MIMDDNLLNIENSLIKHNINAISIAVIDNYEIKKVVSYGKKVNNDTMFQVASISKFVTAFATLILVEKNYIDLDKDISEYLDEETPKKLFGGYANASIRQILTHTAGFNNKGYMGYRIGSNIPTSSEILTGKKPCISPRVKQIHSISNMWRYSCGGFMVLQRIIEKVTNTSFDKFIKDYVFIPLNMNRSSFNQFPKSNIANGYTRKGKMIYGGHLLMPQLAAAGLWSTASDLAKLGIHIQRILNGEHGLVSRELIEEMVEPQIYAKGGAYSGLGCAIKKVNDIECFGHGGSNFGFKSDIMFSRENGKGCCILTNCDSAFSFIEKLEKEFIR